MNLYYILERKTPKLTNDVLEWSKHFEDAEKRIVNQTRIGDVKVSTVFLGINHGFNNETPVLFETMIFGGEEDGYCNRYCTWDEAVIGHDVAVDLVNNKKNIT